MSGDIFAMASGLVELAVRREATFSFAESCTGGLVGASVTEVPGASEVFLGSAVTYCNQAKHNILGVSAEVLAVHGAVSAECAAMMAVGARRIYGADMAVSVTGIAGPDGGSEEKPVGTVWFGFDAALKNIAFTRRFSGTRQEIREASVREVLAFLTGELS